MKSGEAPPTAFVPKIVKNDLWAHVQSQNLVYWFSHKTCSQNAHLVIWSTVKTTYLITTYKLGILRRLCSIPPAIYAFAPKFHTKHALKICTWSYGVGQMVYRENQIFDNII